MVMLNDYEQEKKLLLDIATPARCIEQLIKHTLLPPERGLYLPFSAAPLIVENKMYFQYKVETDEMIGFHGEDLIFDVTLIRDDVYTENRTKILNRAAIPLLATTPSLPIRSIGIIYDLINNHLVQHFAFNSKDIDLAEHAIVDRVLEEFKEPKTLADIASSVYDLFSPTRSVITDFMGCDHYRRHLARLNGDSVMIVKQPDYRIMRFNELLADGEIDAPKKVWDHTY